MDEFLTNHQFTVYINDKTYGFAKVSNLGQEEEYESILEGGRNWTPLYFRKPSGKFGTLTLEKGMRSDAGKDEADWMAVGLRLTGVIIAISDMSKESVQYTFDEGYITKVEVDNLDAMGNSVLLRKVEIAHSGLKRMR